MEALGGPMSTAAGNAPQVELVALAESHRPAIAALMQLYQYDFSEIEPGIQIESDGRFHGEDDFELANGYLIRVDGFLAGFALARRCPSAIDPSTQVWYLDALFILRGVRRRGIGARVFKELLNRHPGRWELMVTPRNVSAQAFWRSLLREVGGEEHSFFDGRWGPRPLFRVGES